MNRDCVIGREEFLTLTTEEIRRIVLDKKKPKVGIFVADGNRHLVMCKTRLSPTSDAFYEEYARFFVHSLRESLTIFFSHGLNILFFPLFGPSLLIRKNKFQSITIPAVYRQVFQSEEWFRFYEKNDIRVRAYGDLSQLEKIDVNRLNMEEGIRNVVEKTASHNNHILYFGFMSENTPGLEMPLPIINFYKSEKRPPTPQEMIKMYYGEIITQADFIIFSNKFSGHGALPPFISTQKAKMYFFPVPGFAALNNVIYRRILYDLLFTHSIHSPTEYSNDDLAGVESLSMFYHQHKNVIIGTDRPIGKFWVPDILDEMK